MEEVSKINKSSSNSNVNGFEVMMIWLLGANILFFYPVLGHIKIFDILSIFIIILNLKLIRFRSYDFLYLIFISVAFLSSFNMSDLHEESLLQSLRYLIGFILATIISSRNVLEIFIKGVRFSIHITLIWMIFDNIFYYSIGGCVSLNQIIGFGGEESRTVFSSISLLGCPSLRTTGFGWDPGGTFPMLIAAILFVHRSVGITSIILSIISLSKTTIGALIFYKFYPKIKLMLPAFVIILIFMPAITYELLTLSGFLPEDEGLFKHVMYPVFILGHIIDNPRLFFIGDGLRNAAESFSWSTNFTLASFIDSSTASPIVESIWLNHLTGVGFIGAIFFHIYLYVSLKNWQKFYIFIISCGMFYTFDNSQFCLLIPLICMLEQNLNKNNKLIKYNARKVV